MALTHRSLPYIFIFCSFIASAQSPLKECHFNYVSSAAELADEITNHFPKKDPSFLDHFHADLTFKGHFKNESPQLLKAFQELSRKTDAVHDFHIDASCDSVLCAVKKIWGDTIGVKMLYLKVFYGLNTSSLGASESEPLKSFDEIEIEEIVESVKHLPREFFPLHPQVNYTDYSNHQNFSIKRVAQQKNVLGAKNRNIPAAGDTDGVSYINLYDVYSNGESSHQNPWTHEIAHNIYYDKNNRFKKHWQQLSGWHLSGKIWSAQDRSHFVSNYGGDENNWSADDEDFAESVYAYRYTPLKLKSCCGTETGEFGNKYDFLKKFVFGGLEYLSENCLGVTSDDLKRITEELTPVTSQMVGKELIIRSIDRDALVKRAHGIGIEVNEMQAVYILDYLSTALRKQLTET